MCAEESFRRVIIIRPVLSFGKDAAFIDVIPDRSKRQIDEDYEIER